MLLLMCIASSFPPLPPTPRQEYDMEYTPEELNKSIAFLNLPTWSRGYKPCTSPESEVSCSQIVHAAKVIRKWETNTATAKAKKYLYLHHPIQGLGNKMNTDIVAFLVALMSNRALVIESYDVAVSKLNFGSHSYEYPPSVITSKETLPEVDFRKAESIPLDVRWGCFDVKGTTWANSTVVTMQGLIYAGMIYVNDETARFARKHFGIHAAYFLGNYLSRFPKEIMEGVQQIYAKVPEGKKVLGLHMRYHRAGQYYSHGLNHTLPTIFKELKKYDEDTYFALATDNIDIRQSFLDRFGDRVLIAEVVVKPDADHYSAMLDMGMVMGSDSIIATWRSSYSYILVSKSGNRAKWIEKESPEVFEASNSQAGCVSVIYHHRDTCDWRTNDRVSYCSPRHAETLRYFFSHLTL